jgi:hypothetical protein
MRYFWLVVPALTLACDSTAGPGPDLTAAVYPDLGEPFQLRVGERAVLDAVDLEVYFSEVASDSRCPSNALILCVWEGDAAVVVETSPIGADPRHHVLHTTLPSKSVVLGTVRLTLEVLDPYPEDVTPIPPDEYTATFVVETLD